jgi:diguanylate cyclase (GGDEF)-like protein
MKAGIGALRARIEDASRVWWLNLGLMTAAGAIYFSWVRTMPALQSTIHIPWWALSLAFFGTEICVVHIQLRRDAHSFSLSEIPLILGLAFVAPHAMVAAQVLGSGLALGLHRRQSPLKLLFNLAHFTLEADLAVLIFRTVARTGTHITPSMWAGAFAATSVASMVAVGSIFLAIRLSKGEPSFAQFRRALTFGLIAAVTNTSIGLVGITVLSLSPVAAWLMLVPAMTLFLAYRAYAEERRKHESLGFLYEATKIVTQSPRVESGMLALLSHARSVFRAEIADITVISGERSRVGLRTTVGPGEDIALMQRVSLDEWPWNVTLRAHQAALLSPAEGIGAQYSSDLRDVMVAPIMGETRMLGTMMIANRLGDVTTFDDEDLTLFQTFVNHISVWLENSQLEESLAELNRLKEELKHQAFHDSLTGLANRELFADRVEHAAARASRGTNPNAVLFLDLDDFKTINDSLGHTAGDQLLQAFADRLRQCLRPADTAARLGGDEFAILLEGISGTADAIRVADRIGSVLEHPFVLGDKEVSVGTSIGIAMSADREAASDLLRNADMAMYAAKNRGKSRYEIFQPSMHQSALERLELKEDLARAIQRHELVLHYQPIVELANGQISGVEALVRWNHPRRGLIPPADFIPLAEESGLIHPIGRWVLNEACRQTRLWQARYPRKKPLWVSVNLSGKQIQRDGFTDDVSGALRRSGLMSRSLILEITESVLLDREAAMRRLAEMRKLGVRVAIDDFGTGYSSLSYLNRFPIDILKVDQSFVRDMDGARGKEILAHAVIDLTKTLGLEAVAEGIEQRGQGARLQELGCKLGQGYFYSRPLDPTGIEDLLRSSKKSLADLPAPAVVLV